VAVRRFIHFISARSALPTLGGAAHFPRRQCNFFRSTQRNSRASLRIPELKGSLPILFGTPFDWF
jgi:hypothetical protein